MQLTCQHCQAAWEFSDRRPVFCPFCGKSLPPEVSTAVLPATAPADSEAETQACRKSAAADAGDPEVVGGYRLLRVLGVGGMGKVYEAEDVQTGRRVALKLVSADYAGSADAVERFRQEGRLASLIAHPRCVFILAADEDAGRAYIVMELMPGDSLDDYVRRNGPQPPTKAVQMILDVIEGLQEAHRVGVVHRDVKPSNCFFGSDGRLKVGDFGLSKSLAQGAHLTKTGSFLGTPLYASPEQVRAEHVDAQTDVYSVAATLYYLLTGRAPFQSDNAAVTLARIAADPPPSMRTLRPELSPMLDRVVLRGLERDRKRRWQNLDDLAEALRPFLPGPGSLASVGIRVGAMVLDYCVARVIYTCLAFLVLTVAPVDPIQAQRTVAFAGIWQLVNLVLWLLYFLPEGIWGASLGKWLLDLRVRHVSTGMAPGVVRGLLRTGLTFLLLECGTLTSVFIVLPLLHLHAQPTQEEALAMLPTYMVLAAVPWLGHLLGAALMASTMRARNGYRGLHEFLSGTCVVLPPRRRTWAVTVTPPSQTLSRPPDVPEKIGSYQVRTAFRWDDRAKVLLGFDAVLGRQVVLWLRPAAEPALGPERREVSRTTRLRWLSAGHCMEHQWDAFVAPGGCSLPALVEAHGRLPWRQVQTFLKQLTDELLQAVKEATLPPRVSVEHVWIQADGRPILLDMPFTQPPQGEVQSDVDEISEKQALGLLAQAALLALEGRRPPKDYPLEIRAPLPLPAAVAVRKLLNFQRTAFRLRAFQERLTYLQDKPPEVTRARRTGQLALMVLFLFCCFGCCLSPPAGIMRFATWMAMANMQIASDEQAIEDLDEASLSDFLSASLNPNPLGRVSVVPSLDEDNRVRQQLETRAKRTRQQLDDRAKWGGSILQASVAQNQQGLAQQRAALRRAHHSQGGTNPRTLRQQAAMQANSHVMQDVASGVETTVGYAPFLLGPLVWVVWAFLMRGGLSYLITGIALVGRDGRPAGRFRCAWRAFLVWMPIAGLLLLSLRLEDWYWSLWGTDAAPVWALWTASILTWSAWLLLGAYLILALRYPTRSPLDRLAGTYLVPSR
jgi:hypothetical protein